MNRFLWGGWVARPCAFYFLRMRWFLVFGVGVVAPVLLGSVALLNRANPYRTLSPVFRYA